MSTLIMGTAYVATAHRVREVTLWHRLVRKLNPDTDIVVVDAASPFNPQNFLDAEKTRFIRLDKNVGHLSQGGMDGWGCAFTTGLAHAQGNGYEHIAYIDTDIMFAHPVADCLVKLQGTEVHALCPIDFTYQFLENGLMFMDAIAARTLVEDYDWRGSTLEELPERKVERILLGELLTLPLRGCRNDRGLVTAQNIRQVFPFGVDYLTHCADYGVYVEFLKVNKIHDLCG